MVDQIVSGKSAAYRKASEALHGAAPSWDRRATHYRVLWECGYGDLIRADFYRLFAFPAGVTGHLLEAGCGTGIEVVNLQRQAPGLRIQGVDVPRSPWRALSRNRRPAMRRFIRRHWSVCRFPMRLSITLPRMR